MTALLHRPRRSLALAAFLTVALAVLAPPAQAVGTGTVEPPPRAVFLARADNPADALAAGPVAGRLGAPLLTTPSGALDGHAREALVAFDPDLVVLAGGTAALSSEVEAAVAEALPAATVRRVAGAGRTETARRLAELNGTFHPAFLPVDATAVDAAHLGGEAAAAFARRDDLALVPRAVVHVAGGTMDAGHGVVAVTHVATGTYCITLDPALGLTGDDVLVQTSVDWSGSTGNDVVAHWASDAAGCGAGDAKVVTFGVSRMLGADAAVVLTNRAAFVATVFERPAR